MVSTQQQSEPRVRAQGRVFVIGNGMTKFMRPGKHSFDYPDLAHLAMSRALRDANLHFDKIEAAYVGYVYGDSTAGQRAVYTMGRTGIPIVNVNNNCATGATALYLGAKAIQSGQQDCVLALGFEKMYTGSLKSFFTDRANPLDKLVIKDIELQGESKSPMAPRLFGNAGAEHMERHGTKVSHFAKVAHKNHKHSVNNPYSQFRDEYTLEQIEKSPKIHYPLTKLQCCPTSDGSAAAILCSEQFLEAYPGLKAQAVEVKGLSLVTDMASSFQKSSMDLVGYQMSKKAAQMALKEAKLTPQQVQVCELHDCFAANELITYEALGLCAEGTAGKCIDNGDFTYGGRVVVNPSGGLISKGHPLGATGLAQCAELCWQLRGMADKRQVKNCDVALQHNLGLGGACVVAAYQKYEKGTKGWTRAQQTADPSKLEEMEKAEGVQAKL